MHQTVRPLMQGRLTTRRVHPKLAGRPERLIQTTHQCSLPLLEQATSRKDLHPTELAERPHRKDHRKPGLRRIGLYLQLVERPAQTNHQSPVVEPVVQTSRRTRLTVVDYRTMRIRTFHAINYVHITWNMECNESSVDTM